MPCKSFPLLDAGAQVLTLFPFHTCSVCLFLCLSVVPDEGLGYIQSVQEEEGSSALVLPDREQVLRAAALATKWVGPLENELWVFLVKPEPIAAWKERRSGGQVGGIEGRVELGWAGVGWCGLIWVGAGLVENTPPGGAGRGLPAKSGRAR